MKITFIRESERDCRIRCECDNGAVLAVRNFSRQLGLPHDLAHYIVERDLGLAWGFWGLVAAGATFTSVTLCSGRKRPHYREVGQRLITEHHEHLGGAEMLVSVLVQIWQGVRDANTAATRAVLTWASQRAGVTVDRECIARVCAMLSHMEAQWLSLDPGASLTLDWPTFSGRRPRGGSPDSRYQRSRAQCMIRQHPGRVSRR
jgi:hypothetical protein